MPNRDLNYLSYPALIEIKGTTGSGFHLYDNENVYLVSAAHVLLKNKLELFTDPVIITALDSVTLTKTVKHSLDSPRLFADGNFCRHPDGLTDVAVCRIGTMRPQPDAGVNRYRMDLVEGVTQIGYDPATYLQGTPLSMTALYASVIPGEPIFMMGYPTSLAEKEDALDRGYPLLRSGIVAGKPPSNKIIIDCPTYPGNSGGLVLRAEDRHSVGVAIRNIGFVEKLYSSVDRQEVSQRRHNSGYTVVEPMDRVIETINELKRLAKSTNQPEALVDR
ncbi:trypsin-like peptidase domain-containing protein [Tardiphaga sp. 862_B3_N4_1]|uniref:trypsin-like peptidase domain-containing protein n=1 Tax=Tardiphaga sp. 862_B3_N4_1 TaxID=3240764 RepID=UPI003F2499FE